MSEPITDTKIGVVTRERWDELVSHVVAKNEENSNLIFENMRLRGELDKRLIEPSFPYHISYDDGAEVKEINGRGHVRVLVHNVGANFISLDLFGQNFLVSVDTSGTLVLEHSEKKIDLEEEVAIHEAEL